VAPALPDIPTADATLERIDLLRGARRRLTTLSGGHVNRTFRVQTSAGQYVARFTGSKNSLLWIDAEAEAVNARIAAAHGVGPHVRGFLPEERVLLLDWIEGRPLCAADFADPQMLARVAQLCRRLHDGPRFAGDFDLIATRRRYLRIVEEHAFPLPHDYHEYESQAVRIEDVLTATAPPTVPCHNDLVGANIMDDGERLWFIDYEYSGNADPGYELGNLVCEAEFEAGLGSGLAERLVTAYLGEPSPAFAARVRLYSVLCHYTWALWASIQHAVGDTDIDFWEWGLRQYAHARAGFAAPDVPELLIRAATG
jgi:thiamine kinase-like enzyme